MGEPLTKTQLDETVAAWRADLAARGHDVAAPVDAIASKGLTVPEVNPRDAMLINSVVKALAPHVVGLEKRITELSARVSELESAQGEMRYCGVWREGKEYTSGSFATHDGALFHANRKTSQKPGSSGDWILAAKSGQPVAHGRNGHAGPATSRPRSP